jgi:hypothetical protein
MDEQEFSDLLAGLDEPAVEAAEVAPEAETPLLDSPPSETPETESPVAGTAADTTDHRVVGQLEPTPEEAKQQQWASEENPYFDAYQQWQRHAQQLEAERQQWIAQQQQAQVWQQQQQMQAQALEDEKFLRELTAGDLEAYDRAQSIIQSRVQPLAQQNAVMNQQMTHAQKVAAAVHIAATQMLPEESRAALDAEVHRLLALQSPDQMLADIQYRRQIASARETELERIKRENEELKRYVQTQRAVQARRAQGADLVSGGTAPSTSTALDQHEDFDSFFSALIGAA